MGSAGMAGEPAHLVCLKSALGQHIPDRFHFSRCAGDRPAPPVCGSGSLKPQMPCLSGRFPVAMEFHSMGERIGRSVARFPMTPRLMRNSSAGILSGIEQGVITFQSAASQPTKRTRFASRVHLLSALAAAH